MKQTSYLVIYKDSPKAHARYFGPFVSIDVATVFMDELPEPLKGGYKDYRITQPFTASDTAIIRDLLASERQQLAA